MMNSEVPYKYPLVSSPNITSVMTKSNAISEGLYVLTSQLNGCWHFESTGTICMLDIVLMLFWSLFRYQSHNDF